MLQDAVIFGSYESEIMSTLHEAYTCGVVSVMKHAGGHAYLHIMLYFMIFVLVTDTIYGATCYVT
jgi:hypothetical protein